MPQEASPGLQFGRPQGWMFAFAGVNVRSVADHLDPTKYSNAVNVRAGSPTSLQTRPGYTFFFRSSVLPITDIRAYAVIAHDDAPRLLLRDASNQIWLDNGSSVANLGGSFGFGVSMIPFRPQESPTSWMYIASLNDYRKFASPDPNRGDYVQQYFVGIAEPQNQCEAAANTYGFTEFTSQNNWANNNNAGTVTSNNNRVTDTAGNVYADPVVNTRLSVTVSSNKSYQAGEVLLFTGANNANQQVLVQDVLPPIPATNIKHIRYDTGNNGNCTIVPFGRPSSDPTEPITGLRRGALVTLGNNETAFVQGTALGPDGSVAFFTSTNNSHNSAETLTGVPAIIVDSNNFVAASQTISSKYYSSNLSSGLGQITQTLGTNPFATAFGLQPSANPTSDDYIHISMNLDHPELVTEIDLMFNVDSTDTSFTKNVLYYAIRPGDLTQILPGTQTQLQAILTAATDQIIAASDPSLVPPTQTEAGASQWTEILFPISALTRLGNDETRTLANCTGVQIRTNVFGSVVLQFGSLWTGGGFPPDVGDDGAAYQYRIVPRNSLTGAIGNASPRMRYGVRPRRQQVVVNLPDVSYDNQIDIVDVYRYGGSVLSYRYIASVPLPLTQFVDTYFDDTATRGPLLDSDNFEPWPTIDQPFRVNTVGSGGVATITINGTKLVVTNFASWPPSIGRWLPGTIIQLVAGQAYTLRKRPIQLSATSYLFDTEECASQGTAAALSVLEPKVARGFQPYMWGPDESGTVFGVGDQFRPGTLSFTKPYHPDSAPDSYTIDLCPPSEPLLGGVVLRGISLVGSTLRWWALYPAFATTQRYNPVEQPVGRPLIGPYGHTTDGTTLWFWSKDGIYASGGGGKADSLTDPDLYPLFPHEGVPGTNVTRNGITWKAPDYGQAASFRLSRVNNYLYADYIAASDGSRQTWVYDLRAKGWALDIYADPVCVHYQPEGQSGSLLTMNDALYKLGVMGHVDGDASTQSDCVGDNHIPISCLVATFEWDGGDVRAFEVWGDGYVDLLPQDTVTIQPTSLAQSVGAPTTVNGTGARTFQVVSLGGGTLQNFMGLVITWAD